MTESFDADVANRREGERKQVRLSITLNSDSNLYVGFAANLSEGGVFVATHDLLQLGQSVDLEFRLHDEARPIQALGVVRWRHEPDEIEPAGVMTGFGVEFVEILEEDLQRLRRFLTTREPIVRPESIAASESLNEELSEEIGR